jgi:2-keto-4-pentenoate hydratase/2-oxohepta-3-ene-1,7-dioic acid hydratase in catechol pathway
MRLVAFSDPNADDPTARRLGVVSAEMPDDSRRMKRTVRDITRAIGPDMLAAIRSGVGAIQDLRTSAEEYPIDELTLHAPIPRPGKIVCVGLNYHHHCREQGVEPPAYPMLFAKFANTVTDPAAPIVRPRATEKLDLECELAVVIGRLASQVAPSDALDHVFGYTVMNDVTARDLQGEDRQWLRAKGWDGFAPMGPLVVTADEIADIGRLAIRSWVNGEIWQESNTADMIWDVPTLIAFVSRSITLDPGDIIATGTPAGVGHFHDPPRYLADGDVMACEIAGIGVLSNTIRDELPRAADHGQAAGIGSVSVRA